MRDNGLPYFRPGENRDAEMAEGLETLKAQERAHRHVFERSQGDAEICGKCGHYHSNRDVHHYVGNTLVTEQLEVLAAQERERIYQVRLRALDQMALQPQGFYDRLRESLSR